MPLGPLGRVPGRALLRLKIKLTVPSPARAATWGARNRVASSPGCQLIGKNSHHAPACILQEGSAAAAPSSASVFGCGGARVCAPGRNIELLSLPRTEEMPNVNEMVARKGAVCAPRRVEAWFAALMVEAQC
jgi:hypothetical protein